MKKIIKEKQIQSIVDSVKAFNNKSMIEKLKQLCILIVLIFCVVIVNLIQISF
jgi:hypothetical protein